MTREKMRNGFKSFRAFFISDNLSELALLYGSDKYGDHQYTPIYQSYFEEIRCQKLNIMEIGVGADDNPRKGGNSLKMWSKYFANSQIIGLDLYDKSFFNSDRIKIFQGNQNDTQVLSQISNQFNLDIIIDDGGHICSDIIISFEFLFDHLKSNGYYIIEDTQTSYWAEFGGDESNINASQTSMNYFKSLVDSTNITEMRSEDIKSNLRSDIEFIHFYHNLIVIKKK